MVPMFLEDKVIRLVDHKLDDPGSVGTRHTEIWPQPFPVGHCSVF